MDKRVARTRAKNTSAVQQKESNELLTQLRPKGLASAASKPCKNLSIRPYATVRYLCACISYAWEREIAQ